MPTQPIVGLRPLRSEDLADRKPLIDVAELDRGEIIAVVGGALLAVSIFFSWYSLGNKHALLNRLLAAALAPAILAWIILRGHALSWPRGELTAVIAVAALTFTIFRGLIDKPGAPTGQIGVDYGWFVALLGGLLILAGSIWRSRESAARRKPPGVL